MPDALLTGGTGVVGKALLRHLLDHGWGVRALARSAPAAASIEAAGATACRGDVLDPASLFDAAQGCDLLFHVAGLNAYCQRNPDRLLEVNVRGTLNALRAAEAAGIARMVHTSSAVTIGEPEGVVGREDVAHRGYFLTEYERAKYEAEQALLSERSPVEVVVVNPASVQGPGRLDGTGRFFLDLIRGRQPLLYNSRLSIVDLDDCAVGHLLAAESGRPGRRYLLSGFSIETRQLVEMLSRLSGRHLHQIWIPRSALASAGWLSAAAARLTASEPRLCPETVRNIGHGAVYDGSRASRELGLDYRSAEDCMRRLVDWYRREGLI